MVAVQSDTTIDHIIDMLLSASEASNDARLDHLWTLLHNHEVNADQFVKLVEVLARFLKPNALFEEAIGLALFHDAVRVARQLAARGQELEPDNTALQKWGRILAPPKILTADLPPRPDLAASMDWLGQHSRQYARHWVALDNGSLIGAADNRDTLLDQIGNPADTSHILITWVP